MDLKSLIILLVTLFAVILLYKEVITIRHELYKDRDEVRKIIDDKIDELISDINKKMASHVDKLKNITFSNIKQMRKINILNNQSIRKISNHYTETDDSEFNNENYKNIISKNDSNEHKIYSSEMRDNDDMSDDNEEEEHCPLLPIQQHCPP